MLNAILTGISIGLGLAVSVGPYFLFLINTSISEGKSSASYLATGVALNDLIFLSVAFLSVNFLMQNLSFIENAKGYAGFFILAYGIYTIIKKPAVKPEKPLRLNPKEKLKNILRGFLFNGLNPSVFVFWFATVGILLSKTNFNRNQTLAVFLSIVSTTFTSDLIKVRLAEFFSNYFTAKLILKVNRVVGSFLILGACYLLIKAFLI
ncbi:RhtB Putative threonine efflux protein [Spirosomataceae bacterium]|jgi:threonine/homoserine/homoserine lactone efflux protein